ncbi:MAG: 4'-phosphopantetheinyl transferase superfamily protein [Solirubrobacteraceae bacterium]|nr:4'-phosphopantetheinyl transferase superfamily protein [Solirubrobacteraceae bacterium]
MHPSADPIPSRLAVPGPGELEVWWTPIDLGEEVLSRAATALDPISLAKAERMRRDADRRRSLLAHALLRQLLSAVTGTPPAELVLERRCAGCGATDHGRPYLSGGPSFGISHGGDVAAVVLGAPDASVAVDVEAVQLPERWDAVRRHAFSADEWDATAHDPGAGRTQLWARKEAVVKATGHGLSIELTRIAFAHAAWATSTEHEPVDHGPLVVDIAPGEPAAPAGPWAAADLDLADDHRAAVAWHGEPVATITTHLAAL